MTPPTRRQIRYQGAIISGDQLLLIQQTEHATGRSYWLLPGGGREGDEPEAACVQREMQEETCLQVAVQRLLLDEPDTPGGHYQRRKTYLCHRVDGDAQPGYEPEPEVAAAYSITEVGWFDLRTPGSWPGEIRSDPITYPQVQRIRTALGYACDDLRSQEEGAQERTDTGS